MGSKSFSCDDNGAKGSGARACVIACLCRDSEHRRKLSRGSDLRQSKQMRRQADDVAALGVGGEVRPATVAQIDLE